VPFQSSRGQECPRHKIHALRLDATILIRPPRDNYHFSG
jgi:hypothetical protein